MPYTPPRKFVATPVEQTTKSSRHPKQTEEVKPKARRFAPEPVEETVRSSKEPRRTKPEDEEKPKPRRFAPEPVEQTIKSSKEQPQGLPNQDSKPKVRRFAPQLVAETEKSSKDKAEAEKKPHVKFKPEPVSTTYSSSRKANKQSQAGLNDPKGTEAEKRPPRKFVPILLDTARRSRRAGDPNAPISQDYRTEWGYHAHSRENWRRVNGEITPAASVSEDMSVEEEEDLSTASEGSNARREAAPLDGSPGRRPDCFKPTRQRSFRLPDLDTIESSESECESSSASPSSPAPPPFTPQDSVYELFKHATRIRESIDENFAQYLLDLERKKAQQRILEEQALAAFVNPDFGYEPPHHYFGAEDSDDFEVEDRPVTFDEEGDDAMQIDRRKNSSRMSWEQSEMQKHAEELQQERNANKVTAANRVGESPWAVPALPTAPADSELKSMRERARPPMLGGDLVFPRCQSPDPARFDVTQGSEALRNRMCYLTEAAEAERKKSGAEGGMWAAPKAANARVSTIKSHLTDTKTPQAKGLWGGFCVTDGKAEQSQAGLKPPQGPTGLITPKNEAVNAFELAFTEGRPVGLKTPGTPGTPPAVKGKKVDLSMLNAVLVTEREFDAMMEREYPDSFITQLYNYLSLGYPSLARPFDEELSKISRVPISELRQDDLKARATPRGYIRLGPDFEGGGGEGMTEESCTRWQALKRYVREWARQEKNMVKTEGVGSNWGTGARRGSWAI